MALKITPEHFAVLYEKITPLDTEDRRAKYRAGEFRNADKVTNLNMRYRWDLLHATGLKIGDGTGIKGDLDLYGYLDDSHIDSALRHLIPEL